jgi:hypothetical protein
MCVYTAYDSEIRIIMSPETNADAEADRAADEFFWVARNARRMILVECCYSREFVVDLTAPTPALTGGEKP